VESGGQQQGHCRSWSKTWQDSDERTDEATKEAIEKVMCLEGDRETHNQVIENTHINPLSP